MILLVPFQVHFSACLECLDMGVGLPPTHISQSEPSKYSKVRAPEGSRARSGLWMTRESFFSFSKSRLFWIITTCCRLGPHNSNSCLGTGEASWEKRRTFIRGGGGWFCIIGHLSFILSIRSSHAVCLPPPGSSKCWMWSFGGKGVYPHQS